MKNFYFIHYFACLFALFFLISACDKLEEDTSPLLAATLVVRNDVYSTSMNQGIQLSVLSNDTISGPTTVQFGQPRHGALQTTGAPGMAFYQPTTNFIGLDTVNYQVCLAGNCITGLVFIHVLPDSINNPCTIVVNDDTISVYQNQISSINILQNDISCNKKPVIMQYPDSGKATINNFNQLVYTPSATFTGREFVRYAVGNATGLVEIRVKPVIPNCTLTANPDVANLPRVTIVDSVAVPVVANDIWCPNAPPISVQLVSQSSYGSVIVTGTGAASKILYMTSTPLHQITDNFQYRICQGNKCSTSTVTIHIQ